MTEAHVITDGTLFWTGDPEANAQFGFDGLSSAQLFPTKRLAEVVIDAIDIDEDKKKTLEAVPVRVFLA